MLSYFEKSKGTIPSVEDSLTATVFDLLKYLPTPVFWRILKRALLQDKLPAQATRLRDWLFWEKWNVQNSDRNLNTRFVEPDVFLRFEDIDIIIEAKRFNEKQQSQKQFSEQVNAYFHIFGVEQRSLYYIQMGGLLGKEDQPAYVWPSRVENAAIATADIRNVTVLKTNWNRLLDSVLHEANSIADSGFDNLAHQQRLLHDIVLGFEMFQFYRLKWLKDLSPRKTNGFTFIENFNYVHTK